MMCHHGCWCWLMCTDVYWCELVCLHEYGCVLCCVDAIFDHPILVFSKQNKTQHEHFPIWKPQCCQRIYKTASIWLVHDGFCEGLCGGDLSNSKKKPWKKGTPFFKTVVVSKKHLLLLYFAIHFVCHVLKLIVMLLKMFSFFDEYVWDVLICLTMFLCCLLCLNGFFAQIEHISQTCPTHIPHIFVLACRPACLPACMPACMIAFICVLIHSDVYSCAEMCIDVLQSVWMCIDMCTNVYWCVLICIRLYWCVLVCILIYTDM